jgi:hypothetical protein
MRTLKPARTILPPHLGDQLPMSHLSRIFSRLGSRTRYRVTVGLAAAALVACSVDRDGPTGLSAPAQEVTTTSTTSVTTLLWSKPLAKNSTVSKVIGPAGGSLSFPNGLKVTVPANAVSVPTYFQVTALAGNIVAYDFAPHGITFAVPLTIEQPTLNTNYFKRPAATAVQGAYFTNPSSLDQSSGTASVSEFEPTSVSSDRAWIRWQVYHFSGYTIAAGATRSR